MKPDDRFLAEVTDGTETALEYAESIVDSSPGAGASIEEWATWRRMTYLRVRQIIELSWRHYEERRERDLRDVR